MAIPDRFDRPFCPVLRRRDGDGLRPDRTQAYGQEVAAIRDCAAKYQDDVEKGNGTVCSISSRRPAPIRRRARPTSGRPIVIASRPRSGTICSTRTSRSCATASTTARRSSCATCSVPGSRIATPPAISTTTRSAARWRSPWVRPAPPARRRAGRCSSSFSADYDNAGRR